MDVDSRAGSQTFSSSEEMEFSPDALNDDHGTESADLMEFEASGLGGVQPADNFSIHVRRTQQQTTPADTSAARRKSQVYSKRILEALNKRPPPEAGATSPKQQHVIKEEILSASRQTLPNSVLPPASFLPFDSCSSGDVDSDLESDVSSNASTTSSSENAGPGTALHLLNISPMRQESSADSEESSSGDSDSDDGSIDLLATARRMDPHTIIASEREYDAALADRLADEIPAGSSAATAGGGSGFNSPADAIAAALNEDGKHSDRRSRAKRQSITSDSLSSRSKLKRNRTRESIATALQENTKRHKSRESDA